MKFADGKVLVEGKMWTAESPATGDFALKAGFFLIERTHQFGSPLAFCVDIGRVQWIDRSGIALGNVRHIAWLFPVHRSRARQQKLFCPMRDRKLQGAFGAGDDSREHFKRGICSLLRAGLGRCVNDVLVFTLWETAGCCRTSPAWSLMAVSEARCGHFLAKASGFRVSIVA